MFDDLIGLNGVVLFTCNMPGARGLAFAECSEWFEAHVKTLYATGEMIFSLNFSILCSEIDNIHTRIACLTFLGDSYSESCIII